MIKSKDVIDDDSKDKKPKGTKQPVIKKINFKITKLFRRNLTS